eukprot:8763330-Lingulodinium_polyedra.AAC.1
MQKYTSKFASLASKVEGLVGTGPREPDWQCSRCGCADNWASKASCRRCGQPRAQPAPPQPAAVPQPVRPDEPTDLKAVEEELKLHRASLAGFQAHAEAPWAQAAMAPIAARVEELRAKQLALKTPVSRVQSAVQRRDRLKADLGKAQLALDEATSRFQAAKAEAERLQEQLQLAEVEFVEATQAVACQAPRPPLAA